MTTEPRKFSFYVQGRAPAGNWFDIVGYQTREEAIRYCEICRKLPATEQYRVVERTDTTIY